MEGYISHFSWWTELKSALEMGRFFLKCFCSCLTFSFLLPQVIGPLEENEVFNQDDFLLLENIILKTSGERIKSKVQDFKMEEDRYFI